ncbi:thiol:disulfide interchange protein DsbD [Catalinimonas alkaloidigena]|uniref:Thiol:disulfide interchange protein DsbD n=1 Tax=Catalinimonas alkaloidigena TaxID=1075417 RepID=A0A1G9EPP6_9BACT|nr:cytochrome c biogenesis protein CcdA [Catalinimonas alkaloidigena]SDK78058.1 thiol:disulfide interchange protein DsbD [Catalinimonas alkaloidigena]
MNYFGMLLAFFLPFVLQAQMVQPPTWTYSVSKQEVKAGDETELIFQAEIDPAWYLYSTDFDPDLGPYVTEFTFTPNATYELVGDIKPINPKKKYDEIWDGEYTYFKKHAEFRQKVRMLKANPSIVAHIEYQICSDETGQCVLFEEDHTFSDIRVSGNAATSTSEPTTGKASLDEKPTQAVADVTRDAYVQDDTTEPAVAGKMPAAQDTATVQQTAVTRYSSAATATAASGGLLGFMVVAFGSGLLALLTPCVFPMIPMTVSFFTRSGGARSKAIQQALIYGLSIILIYTLIGTVISRLNGPEFANFVSTHWLPNILFFAVFIFFALAFLGMFEIVLPSSLVSKVDAQADKGGLVGVFFMAFTLVLVSFSCTGPIVGSLLVASAGGEVLRPIAGMFAFSLAFALPFTLFAIFPQWLSNLPKSGGWLNSVKVVLGFLELALAFKFLSVADQAYHWNLLDREIYLAIWIAVFAGLALYLFGKIRLPHDSVLESISVPRLLLALVTLGFVVYLIPGLFGAPLKALAGYLPPQNTLDFDLTNQRRAGGTGVLASNSLEGCEPPKYDFLHLPHGLQGYFDLEQAMACARAQNKPVFVDFTGHGCVNCREMEARVWSDPRVLQRLNENFVIASLYVDDKTDLPEAEWYVSEYDGKEKRTIGKKNADLQIGRYGNNAQPYYLLLDPVTGKPLVPPTAYDLDVQHFVEFLDAGREAYQQQVALK